MYLNLLIVDDCEDDALLLVRELRKGGYQPQYERVETARDLERALEQRHWQLIITDHNMPGFNSVDVLAMVRRSGLDVPVIIVSGTIGEEVAVHAMKTGAHDYIMKDNLARLIPAIDRELRDAQTRHARNQAEQALSHMAYHDSLTNLLNRSMFHDRLEQALVRARKEDSLLALLFIDLDRFKIINDTYGHTVGDMLLQSAAERLRTCVRRPDLIARFGGDEFVVLMENLSSRNEAASVADNVIESMTKPFRINNHDMYIGSSIGIVFSRDFEGNGESMIKKADVAMFRAKSLGRNKYQFYVADMVDESNSRNQLEQSLYQALERQELELFYQPQVHVHTGRLRGAEVLLRWRHPTLGLVSPAQFIDLLEETGLVLPVGDWVMRTACQQWNDWRKEGLIADDQVVSVNISSYQFKGDDLVFAVGNVLSDTELPAEMLDLELTEGTLMDDTQMSQQVLQTLKEMGVNLSIDDFGTGYSSLSYLKKFPIDCLKIDQSFVRDLTNSPDDAVIATAIIGLSHNLNMRVIAEGVENAEVLEFLAKQNCDMYQGYYYSKPLPVGDFIVVLKRELADTPAVVA
ncbi:MAG TPA: GGDEF domain-containing response regulator [Pseudomonadales bacterium]|nr:GGDEF domain-containing response regulator [Pseudomonadales bacterium]